MGQPVCVNKHSQAQIQGGTVRFLYRFDGEVCRALGVCEAICSLNV